MRVFFGWAFAKLAITITIVDQASSEHSRVSGILNSTFLVTDAETIFVANSVVVGNFF